MIFVVITPGTPMDIDQHLHGYDEVLDFFGFGDWHLVSSRAVVGPNWKIAYDGYLDFYHLPFLHRNSFGPDISNKPIYYDWGPHQRMTSPDPSLVAMQDVPEDEWNLDRMCGGVWTIFPHISFAGGNGGGLISQLFPGPTPGESVTIQNYFVAAEPSDDRRQRRWAWPTSSRPWYTTRTTSPDCGCSAPSPHGAKEFLIFGRNEGGGQRFHTLLDEYLADQPVTVR